MTETRDDLFIPDNAKERPTRGIVVANGPGRVHPDTAARYCLQGWTVCNMWKI